MLVQFELFVVPKMIQCQFVSIIRKTNHSIHCKLSMWTFLQVIRIFPLLSIFWPSSGLKRLQLVISNHYFETQSLWSWCVNLKTCIFRNEYVNLVWGDCFQLLSAAASTATTIFASRSKVFELNFTYLGYRKFRSWEMYWITFLDLDPMSLLWRWLKKNFVCTLK